MMARILALLLFLLPGLAHAESFPALYDVTGVASNDVLNIRMEPSAGSEILGMLAPNARGIEVVRLSDDFKWGLVNQGDGAGWVSMRYMHRQPGQDWGVMPRNVFCSGTEPFWSFNVIDGNEARFDAPDVTRAYSVTAQLPGLVFPGDFAVVAEGVSGRATAIISLAMCNDGMSNREFGMNVGLLLESATPEALYVGCCSLQR